MFLETVRTEGLAQRSYILGAAGEAAVIDPRRDVQIYLDIAYARGACITRVFETHRNEDFVVGSLPLAEITGATIHHGGELPFGYGETVTDGETFQMGNLHLRILKTPGHTDESISIAIFDADFGEEPVGVFTGDALFIGDVGRTDFFPDRAKEVAGLLYDSIFNKLLPLGPQAILYPAHGAGSVCGSGMAEREFSTLGYERKFNPALQVSEKEAFIQRKLNETHYQPPYFRKMEQFNLEGPPMPATLARPRPHDHEAFARFLEEGVQVLDTRRPEAFAGAYIPGSLAMPLGMIPAYAGWFLDYDRDVALVVDRFDDVEPAIRALFRLGFDRVVGYLDGGLTEWETAGKPYGAIPAIYAGNLKARMDRGESFTLLDVRKSDEFAAGHLRGATHLFLGDLPDRLDEVPKDRPVTTFCGNGRRAIIAASILKQNGFEQVEDCLGSMAACQVIGCETVSESDE